MSFPNLVIQNNAIKHFPDLLSGSDQESKKYKVLKYVDQGTYGMIFLLENQKKEQLIAKIIDTKKHKICPKNEIDCMKLCNHDMIVKFYEEYFNSENGHSMVIMEYADAGNLKTAIESKRNHNIRRKRNRDEFSEEQIKRPQEYFSEEEILHTFCHILTALNHVHEKNIIHRDIKPENIYLTSKDSIKLGDFHLSQKCNHDIADIVEMGLVGTPYYIAPEIWRKEKYNYKVDIWALGVVLYELTSLKFPFFSQKLEELESLILKGRYDPLPDCFSDNLHNLVDMMIDVNPGSRPSIKDIMKMDFIKKIIG